MASKKTKTPQEDMVVKGKLGRIILTSLEVLRKQPDLLEEKNFERYRAIMYIHFPELNDKTKCPNCGEGMMKREQKLNYANARLLVSMGKIVNENLATGMKFTEANNVYVSKEPDSRIPHDSKIVAGNTADMGLIAPAEGKGRNGHYVITRRGFAALRGERIPRGVIIFRGEIVGRLDETTTLGEILTSSKSKSDGGYRKEDYFAWAGLAQGTLL